MTLLETDPGGLHPPVRLRDRFDILPGKPAGEFSSGEAAAYCACDIERPDAALFALVCEPGVPPRMGLIEPLSVLQSDALLKPLGWGVVDWPPRGRRCFVLVFEQPQSRIAASLSSSIAPFSDEDVMTNVLPPLMATLKTLFDVGLTHRAVRPTNLFRRANDPRIVLGECVSAPPASTQPLAFEPIESGLALPAGRGAGGPADDLYALGVTLAFLLLGHDPAQDKTEDELLAAKIKIGSFAAILGNERPPLRMIEPIRGLLADNPRERWTLQDLNSWMLHRSVTVRQFAPPKRAGRPLEFDGVGHVTARSLAQAFVRDPAAAVKPIRSNELDGWLQRSLSDAERIAAVAAAMADTGESDGGPRDARLVARVAMALDPGAPVRYLDVAASIDGFGAALAAHFRSGNGATTVAEAIMARLPQFWFSVQGTFKPEQAPVLKSFDRMRTLLEDRRLGFGLARVLYELNPGLHCLSPAIESEHVLEAADVLAALERAAAAGRIAETMIDRQLAAFIAARAKGLDTDWLDDLASANAPQRVLGTVKLLARLQGHDGPPALPALSARIGRELPALIARYRSRTRRDRLAAALAPLLAKGSLVEIVAVVANPAELRRDEAEFRAACAEHAAVERDLALLHQEAELRPLRAAELGGSIAAAAACLLAAAVALCSLWTAA